MINLVGRVSNPKIQAAMGEEEKEGGEGRRGGERKRGEGGRKVGKGK